MTMGAKEAERRLQGDTEMANISPMVKRSQGFEAPAAVGEAEIDIFMRRFFEQTQGEVGKPALPEPPTPPATPPRDFDTAAELLDRASQGFDTLVGRCQHLEHSLEQETRRASAHAAEQDEAIEQWKRLASGLKAQAEASDREIAVLNQRGDAAEARAIKAEQKATALEQAAIQAAEHAASAERLSTKLHDKVVTAFGLGSRAYPTLEAIATQTATE